MNERHTPDPDNKKEDRSYLIYKTVHRALNAVGLAPTDAEMERIFSRKDAQQNGRPENGRPENGRPENGDELTPVWFGDFLRIMVPVVDTMRGRATVYALLYEFPKGTDVSTDYTPRRLQRAVAALFDESVEVKLSDLVISNDRVKEGFRKDLYEGTHNIVVGMRTMKKVTGPLLDAVGAKIDCMRNVYLARRFPTPKVFDIKRGMRRRRFETMHTDLYDALKGTFGKFEMDGNGLLRYTDLAVGYSHLLRRADMILTYGSKVGWNDTLDGLFEAEAREAESLRSRGYPTEHTQERFNRYWGNLLKKKKKLDGGPRATDL